MPDAYAYRAFISYSHADAAAARELHQRLERYRVPARLVGRHGAHGPVTRRLGRCFRDQAELSAASHLGETLQQALREAQTLIIVCSPSAARSAWVDEEIRYFRALGRGDRIYAVVVAGEPRRNDGGHDADGAFPPALLADVDGKALPEPLAADARPHKEGSGDAFLKLVAALIGVGFDELRRREQNRRARLMALALAASLAVASLTTLLAFSAYRARNAALQAQALALRHQQQAEDLLQFMLGDLRDKLKPIGKLSILDAVDQKAMDYFAQSGDDDASDAALASRGRALRHIGEVRNLQGDPSGALQSFLQALKLDEALAARNPAPGHLKSVADSQKWIGEAHYLLGDYAAARDWWQRQRATAQRLLALQPGAPHWQAVQVEATGNLGAVAFAVNDLDGAEAQYGAALRMQQALVMQAPQDAERLQALAELHAWLCTIKISRRDWPQALAQAEQQVQAQTRLLQLEPDNAAYREGLAKAQLNALYNKSEIAAIDPADPLMGEALRITAELIAQDGDNIEYAIRRIAALNYRVDAQVVAGELDAAQASDEELLDLARRSYRRAPHLQTAGDYLMAMLIQGIKLQLLRGRPADAAALIDEAAALLPALTASDTVPSSRQLELDLLRWWQAGERADAEAAQARASASLARLQSQGETAKPESMLRYEVLRRQPEAAARWWAQLSTIERRHPFLRQFCAQTAGC